MGTTRALAGTVERIVRRRTVRRLRETWPILRRVPSCLLVAFARRSAQRRAHTNLSQATTTSTVVVTCQIGKNPAPALRTRIPDAVHVCFTDRPERVPRHWRVRPIEYWASSDELTRLWIRCHLSRLLGNESSLVWVDPYTCEASPIDGDAREHWIALNQEDIGGETSTGSRRWFGDQSALVSWGFDRVRRTADPKEDPDASVTIVVPVHNAPREVERCLDSVIRTMRAVDRLVVVDDGSTAETARLCDRFADLDRVSLIRRPTGSGFPTAANSGIEACASPYVIVLNSDTRVPRGWVSRLVAHLESHPEVAAIGPMSNAARFQSIPYLPSESRDNRNSRPANLGLETLNEFLQLWSSGVGPVRVPLLNGFCLGFRRPALETIGLFDTSAFPRGFGEENDWCARARRVGYDLLVATDVYVEHTKGSSYSSIEAEDLKARATRILAERYGRTSLDHDLTALRYPAALVALRADVQALWDAVEGELSFSGSV